MLNKLCERKFLYKKMPITFAADLVPDISGLKGNHVTIVSYPRSCKASNA